MFAPRLMSSLAAALLVGLSGCADISLPDIPDSVRDPFGGGGTLVLPDSVAGGDRSGRSRLDRRTQDPGEVAAERERQRVEAEALWARATAATSAEDAADLYGDIASDYPASPRAAEARYLQGVSLFRMGEYRRTIEALAFYMEVAPVNPHLAEVERMIYESGTRLIQPRTGLGSIFLNDDEGLKGLQYIAETFTAGEYADDALWQLAQYYDRQEDWSSSVLHYKELLQRYPDSEWSFRARLAMADAYRNRDEGAPYHAGFIDLDPREEYANEGARLNGADVVSSPGRALDNYEKYLERMRLDPSRQREYAAQVNYAQQQRAAMRESLAAKDLGIARWYLQQGDTQGARTYFQYAARYNDTPSGRQAIASLGGVAPVPAAPVVPVPSPVAPPVRLANPQPARPVIQPPARPAVPAVPAPPSNWPPATTPTVPTQVQPVAPSIYGEVPPRPPPPSTLPGGPGS